MAGDNRIFNVNGEGKEMLRMTLRLVFLQEGENTTAVSFVKSKKGLILLWYKDKRATELVTPHDADMATEIAWAYLKDNPEEVEHTLFWDQNQDHDGSNGLGWRVYCEDWGHVDGMSSAICAIKPAFMWYGK